MNLRQRHDGQAMTEFLVASAALIVPLFILIPLLGKLTDLSFQTELAGRYVTWERTVWFRDNEPSGVTTWAERSDNEIARSVERRFFGREGMLIEHADIQDGWDESIQNPVWNYALSGGALFERTDGARGTQAEKSTPSLAYEVVEAYNSVVDILFTPLDVLNVTDGEFGRINHNTKAYYTPTVSASLQLGGSDLRSYERWIAEGPDGGDSGLPDQIVFHGAILADGWNAADDNHFRNRADDFVLTEFFDNVVFNTVIDILSFEILPGRAIEPALNDLEWKYIGTDPINDRSVVCRDGFCAFE